MIKPLRLQSSSQIAAATVAAFLLFSPSSRASDYFYQTLDNNADPTFNQLLSINNSGTIAGYFGNGTTKPNKGYTLVPPYGQANYTNENFPGSVQTQVTGINNSGLTVGFWADALVGPNNFGFVDNAGTFTTVQDPSTPTTGTKTNQLLGVNDKNQAAGFYVDASGVAHGYIYNITPKTFTPVANPGVSGQPNVTATGINNKGWISGFTENAGMTAATGFLDVGGVEKTYEFKQGGFTSTFTQFFGLNNYGLAVGDYVNSTGGTEGFVFNYYTKTWTSIDASFQASTKATPGTTVINGINDLGDLVGFYTGTDDNVHGLLVSTPEPASLGFMMLAGLGAAFGCFLRRRKA
ncbi:MAG: PEP-CTERM sorting domain-containing protein [Acidobacteriaceae bacterium]|nr:PEP-CTERM sorting domain-containing protein [Acidobacteriaceae bacterium]MBV9764690.1 PEP-CTERM sorting domain-containing protein [Acidobacteriaceae bacterium]